MAVTRTWEELFSAEDTESSKLTMSSTSTLCLIGSVNWGSCEIITQLAILKCSVYEVVNISRDRLFGPAIVTVGMTRNIYNCELSAFKAHRFGRAICSDYFAKRHTPLAVIVALTTLSP